MRLSVVLLGKERIEYPPPRAMPLQPTEWQREEWFLLPPQEVAREAPPNGAVAIRWITIAAVPTAMFLTLLWFVRGGRGVRPRYLNTDFWLGPWA